MIWVHLTQELELNTLVSAPRAGVNILLDWLIEAWTQQEQAVDEVKIPKILWFTVEEEIQNLNEMKMLDQIYFNQPTQPPPM